MLDGGILLGIPSKTIGIEPLVGGKVFIVPDVGILLPPPTL